MKSEVKTNGGKGSGNFGHSGVPGEVGGSGTGGTKSVSIKSIKNPEIGKIYFVNGKDLQIDVYSEEVVEQYMERIENGETFPPTFVNSEDLSWVVDGNHRAEAYNRLGKPIPVTPVNRIDAIVQLGTGNITPAQYYKTIKGPTTNMKEQTFLHDVRIAVNKYSIQKKQYDGVDHLVVPVVMMTEGIRSGSDGPILHSAEELSHIVAAWNGIPVVINHPQNNEGMYISANEPAVANVGRIFNASYVDGKLKAEAWLNPTKLKKVSPEASSYISNQKPLEVSVGVFSDTEYVDGEFNGETYSGIARNYRPDHLALLPGGVGACSWEDGCGIRVNSLQDNGGKGSGNFGHKGRKGEVGGSGDGGDWSEDDDRSDYYDGAKLIGKYKNWEFVEYPVIELPGLPGNFTTPNDTETLNKYSPVVKSEGTRVTIIEQNGGYIIAEGFEDAEWAEAWAKREHPSNKKKSKTNNNMETIFAINSLQDRKTEFRELCDKVGSKLYSMDNDFAYHYPVEIYDDGVIYLSRNRQSGKETFYQQKYSVDEETGELTFEDDPQKVVRKTEYVMQANGGKGSGNFGHSGIPGHQGGSGSGGSTDEFAEVNAEAKTLFSAKVLKYLKQNGYKVKAVNTTDSDGSSRVSYYVGKEDSAGTYVYSYSSDGEWNAVTVNQTFSNTINNTPEGNKNIWYHTGANQQYALSKNDVQGMMVSWNGLYKYKKELNFNQQNNNKNQKGENKMSKSKCAMVSELITNERTRFTEDNREWLMEQDFDTLETLQPKMIANAKIESEETLLTDEAVTSYIATKKQEEIIKLLPSELQANLNTMIKERAERREKMVKEILSINKQFTEIELNAMNCDMLQKVHAMAKPVDEDGKPVDYSAAAGSGAPIQANNSNEDPLMLD